jgi:predicted ester cyclase
MVYDWHLDPAQLLTTQETKALLATSEENVACAVSSNLEKKVKAVGQHKAVVQRFVDEVRNQGNLDAIKDLVVPGLVEETRRVAAAIREAFDEYHVEIERLVGDGDTIVLCATQRGVHRGIWQGLAPTGRTASWGLIRVFEFEDDRISATYAYTDLPALLTQLGAHIVPE